MKKKLILTGGGTAGHVMPILALVPELQENYELFYIGSHKGIERELIERAGIPYYPVSTGKLRRYFSWENIIDPFRTVKGVAEARSVLKKIKPNLVFSKGGFVSVPTVLAAAGLGIPVLLHESDYSPGLANKLTVGFAKRILTTFPETVRYLPSHKTVATGTPVRPQLLKGSAERGRELTGFDQKPVIMIMGGSSGSVRINTTVREALPELTQKFNVLHLCGKGNMDDSFSDYPNYRQYEFAYEELADYFALSSVVISRAGANAIFEFLALRLPALLIPLSKRVSRGDQILNAKSFASRRFAAILEEEELTAGTLAAAVFELYEQREAYRERMENTELRDSNRLVLREIDRFSTNKL